MVLTATRNLLVIGPLLGVPAGVTAQSLDLRNAGYGRGDPQAPVWIVEFGDFGCSACETFARNTMPVLEEESTGDAQAGPRDSTRPGEDRRGARTEGDARR